jgi:hypothetical protein
MYTPLLRCIETQDLDRRRVSTATSSALGASLLLTRRLGFEGSQHLIDSVKLGGDSTFTDVLQAFGELGIDNAALLSRVLVGSVRQFGDDGDDSAGHFELHLKTSKGASSDTSEND